MKPTCQTSPNHCCGSMILKEKWDLPMQNTLIVTGSLEVLLQPVKIQIVKNKN